MRVYVTTRPSEIKLSDVGCPFSISRETAREVIAKADKLKFKGVSSLDVALMGLDIKHVFGQPIHNDTSRVKLDCADVVIVAEPDMADGTPNYFRWFCVQPKKSGHYITQVK